MGGDQCHLSLSLTALYISSNNHHRGHHLAHRFPVQDSQTPSGNKASLTPSVQQSHPQLHSQGRRKRRYRRRGAEGEKIPKASQSQIERAGRKREREREVAGG